ncbi:MAG: nucleic acid-binding protein [Treponemataceae bacterium]|nr:nucleic acid-binding protein [Treponemataceae bacterium]
MEMTEVFDRLKSLQDVLSEKYSLEKKIDESPKKLSVQEELLAKLKREYIEKHAIYENVKSTVAKLRTDLAEAEAARERGEKGMDSITTHREYEALQKEIDDATQLEQQIRKELQKEEKNLTGLDEGLKQDEQLIDSQEAELNSGRASLEQEIEEHKNQLENLKKQEAELNKDIDPDIIFKFERIIKSKQGKGIVAVKGNVCDGCHMILPAQFANEVHNGEKIVFCPYCSRILFYQDVEEGETEYFHLEDTGSLSDLDDDFADEEDGEYDEDSEMSERDDGDDIKNLDDFD